MVNQTSKGSYRTVRFQQVISLLFGLLLISNISGCSNTRPEPIIKEVLVEVPVISECPESTIPPLKILPIVDLGYSDTLQDTAKAYYLSLVLLQLQLKEHRELLQLHQKSK